MSGRPELVLYGPAASGAQTVTHRLVLLRWPDGQFSVHNQQLLANHQWSDEHLSDGDYFPFDRLTAAYHRFLKRHETRTGDLWEPDEPVRMSLMTHLSALPVDVLGALLVMNGSADVDDMVRAALNPKFDPQRKEF